MEIIYYKNIETQEICEDAQAEAHLICITIPDINLYAQKLIEQITNTSWISQLNNVARMSYEEIAMQTIQELVKIFQSVENEITSDFGEYMISMSSGNCLKDQHSHINLPLSELWKEKIKNNHGFDFHTISPRDKFSFGEAKYQRTGNSYPAAAEQAFRFSLEGKDKRDAVHLLHLGTPNANKNFEENRKGYIVAFSITSDNHVQILNNALKNENIMNLSKICDELYIIGVKI